MRENIILIIKGFVIGLAKIIPGVSGSLMAISLGLYEDCLEAICSFFKNVKYNLSFLGTVGIGIIMAIVLGSKLISYLLLNFYLPTMFLFIGLIVGTIPNIVCEMNIKDKKDYIVIIIVFLITFLMTSFVPTSIFNPNNNIISFIKIFSFGLIDAATMIIPGISGTAIFILIGCYPFVLELFGNLTNISYILSNFSYFLTFGIGLLFGLISVTYIMNYLLKHYKTTIYAIIIGFALSSVLFLLNTTLKANFTFLELLISILLAIGGYKIAKKLD